jgi:hypothetical protein
LKDNGFSLQAQAKVLEGEQHPDRDAQFRYINEQVKQQQAAGEPVISVDTKKKEEMLGQLPNACRQWRPKGDPVTVDDHSFFSGPTGEAAIPYGVYDLTADSGWVNVGVDHDTSAFAVASIGRWVAGPGPAGLSAGHPPVDHRGCGWFQRLPLPALEGRACPAGRADRAVDLCLRLPAGDLEKEFVGSGTPVTVRQQLSHALSDPRLTGMPRADLTALVDRLSVRQAALIENRRHRQRGGPRQPGSRGGVFRQKITDAERMLAAVLNERKIANRHVLAAAFGVSFRTLSNALADALPVLREADITIPHAAVRFASADEILAFLNIAHPDHTPSTNTPTR